MMLAESLAPIMHALTPLGTDAKQRDDRLAFEACRDGQHALANLVTLVDGVDLNATDRGEPIADASGQSLCDALWSTWAVKMASVPTVRRIAARKYLADFTAACARIDALATMDAYDGKIAEVVAGAASGQPLEHPPRTHV